MRLAVRGDEENVSPAAGHGGGDGQVEGKKSLAGGSVTGRGGGEVWKGRISASLAAAIGGALRCKSRHGHEPTNACKTLSGHVSTRCWLWMAVPPGMARRVCL